MLSVTGYDIFEHGDETDVEATVEGLTAEDRRGEASGYPSFA